MLAEQLASAAAQYKVSDPPAVAVVRMVSPDEQAQLIVDCMNGAGFASQVSSNGWGMAGSMPVEQLTAFNDQAYACTAAYPVDVKYLRPLSTDQLRIVYAYTRDTLLPCLAGLDVTVEDLPSQDVFVSTYGGPDAFDPYRDVSTDQAPYERAVTTCPQMPPAEALYGGK